jgi:hypothetical protein
MGRNHADAFLHEGGWWSWYVPHALAATAVLPCGGFLDNA